tara:strand:- start:402 stop:611 length:210 start_codon:yes stop_codon:yes gene_type:complete
MSDTYDEKKHIYSKEVSSKEMTNKIFENLYKVETLLQEEENEDILKDIYYMLQKKTQYKATKEDQCRIQ